MSEDDEEPILYGAGLNPPANIQPGMWVFVPAHEGVPGRAFGVGAPPMSGATGSPRWMKVQSVARRNVTVLDSEGEVRSYHYGDVKARRSADWQPPEARLRLRTHARGPRSTLDGWTRSGSSTRTSRATGGASCLPT